MDWVLPPHAAYAAAYLNDVIIHSDTWAEHMQLVAAVLESLSQAGFRTNLKKCAVGLKEVQYLGYHLGGAQVPADQKQPSHPAWIPRPKERSWDVWSGRWSNLCWQRRISVGSP